MNFIPTLLFGIMGLGGSELLIILVILLVLFGGSRLPSLAKGLGESIRSFKQGVSDEDEKK
ncbi:MAG: twin-arginine translocase TatA/TatE family subunit [Blastocatellia bacterium]|nr:twin-arginine translocase TatA/TatE family subunit [Blastocatellia bacterium]